MNVSKTVSAESVENKTAAEEELPISSRVGGGHRLIRHWQKLTAALFWVALAAGYLWFTQSNHLTPLQSLQLLVDEMQNSAFGPLLYVLAYAFRPLIFFPATLLTVAGGFLFGPVFGILLTVVAANSSASVAYLIGRFFGRDLLNDADAHGVVRRYADRMRENSFETVLVMRFIFMPYDLVNYLAGLLRINWKAFVLATALGSIPGTITFVLFGASIERFDGGLPSFNPWVLAASGAIFITSLILSRVFKRREQQATT